MVSQTYDWSTFTQVEMLDHLPVVGRDQLQESGVGWPARSPLVGGVSSFSHGERGCVLPSRSWSAMGASGWHRTGLPPEGVAVARAADQLREMSRGDPFGKVEAVLPGSATAAPPRRRPRPGRAALDGLVEALEAHAAAFGAAVTGYRGADADIGDGFSASGRR